MATNPKQIFDINRPEKRVDGIAKVIGAARYAADEPVANPAYAYAVTSRIAKGHITGFKLDAARAVPGVLDILTYENFGNALKKQANGPDGGPTTGTLNDAKIWHDGQIVALVIADSFEAARAGAYAVQIDYAEEKPTASFDDAGAQTESTKPKSGENPHVGDAESAFEGAAVKVDAKYSTPTQHHNALELFSTTCTWEGDRLTLYDPSQFMAGTRGATATSLGIEPANVRAISRYIGGAFGSKGPNPRTAWIAAASQRIGRPVRFIVTREQGFTTNTYRAETRHHLRLGATPEGKLVSLQHDGFEICSRPSKYKVGGTESTARMYACPNIKTSVSIVHADRNTPGYMRAPPETPYMFALESAMDELAVELNLDPIELRRRNDTQKDPVTGLPFSSRSLMKCFDAAAHEFGWSKRNAKPKSMRDGEWLVGYGCATSCYPANAGPAAARVALSPEGKASIQLAGHEIGTGAYTLVALTAARVLNIPIANVSVAMGDSDLPPVVVAGGSSNAASTANVVANACEKINVRKAKGETGRIEVYEEFVPQGLPAKAMNDMAQGRMTMLGGADRKDVTAFSFGAHLVEVRVHERTCEVRVARSVSAFAAGTIVNPLAAYSQFMGGAIWGISSALHEHTEMDHRAARYVNKNLADYLVPVNADVADLKVLMIPEEDTRVNPLGIKGIGEIGIVGMNAAIANAVFHATGKRIRDLPIRIEQLLNA